MSKTKIKMPDWWHEREREKAEWFDCNDVFKKFRSQRSKIIAWLDSLPSDKRERCREKLNKIKANALNR